MLVTVIVSRSIHYLLEQLKSFLDLLIGLYGLIVT